MRVRKFPIAPYAVSAVALALTGAAIAIGLPAIGQETPESLLPPGFGDPPPAANNRPAAPAPVPPSPSNGNVRPDIVTGTAVAGEEPDEDSDEGEEASISYFDVPPAKLRSLDRVGIIDAQSGGYGADIFGDADGAVLGHILDNIKGPLASRWATILTRRVLASRTDTPDNIAGNDWVAKRSRALLNMGEAVVARQLVQQVDASRYSKALYHSAMDIYLANGDLGGLCPLAEEGARIIGDGQWKMARPICASLAGEQGRATALLNQAQAQGWMKGVDYRLAEKAVGAGTNGRRSVKIEWDGVSGFSMWRHGVAQAMGVQPPETVYGGARLSLSGWLAQMPMLSVSTKMAAAPMAGGLGTLSNRAMVDLYSQAYDDNELDAKLRDDAELLRTAYTASSDGAKLSAMEDLWGRSDDVAMQKGYYVLTARAAALIAPSDGQGGYADRIILSMMTGGFDRAAVRWAQYLPSGSLGWALLAVGAPAMKGRISYQQLDDFHDEDESTEYRKSALLLAGLAGLGRVDGTAQADFAGRIKLNLNRTTAWTRAIDAAATRGEKGTVMLLSAAGLQARSWKYAPPYYIFHIVRALRQVGMEAEARMIAAEAVSFG